MAQPDYLSVSMACASGKPPAEVNNQISRNAEKMRDADLLEGGDQIIPQFHSLFHAMYPHPSSLDFVAMVGSIRA